MTISTFLGLEKGKRLITRQRYGPGSYAASGQALLIPDTSSLSVILPSGVQTTPTLGTWPQPVAGMTRYIHSYDIFPTFNGTGLTGPASFEIVDLCCGRSGFSTSPTTPQTVGLDATVSALTTNGRVDVNTMWDLEWSLVWTATPNTVPGTFTFAVTYQDGTTGTATCPSVSGVAGRALPITSLDNNVSGIASIQTVTSSAVTGTIVGFTITCHRHIAAIRNRSYGGDGTREIVDSLRMGVPVIPRNAYPCPLIHASSAATANIFSSALVMSDG